MSQGRTPLFRKLMQTVRQAHWLNENPHHRQFFFEAQEASRVSRRDFVRMLSAAGLLTAAGGLAPQLVRAAGSPTPGAGGGDPVAIIGAGTSGLTAAYRLMLAGIPCEIFEGSDRTGGRMLTKNDFNKDGMFCELGGELVDANHADLIALAGELGVEIQELKGGDQGLDLYFFGGKHYSDKDVIPLFEPFAKKLAADFEGILDAEEEFTEKAGRFDKVSLAEYLAETGKGVEKWVVDMLRVAYTIEYGRDLEEQSALNLIAYLQADTSDGFKIFGDSDESKRIKGGSSSLPNALVKALEGKVKINKGYRLAKIAQAGPNMTLNFATEGGTKSVKFTRVICSLPFTMLRQVEGVKALGLSKEKEKAIAELGYGYNAKVMYGFTERWWRNPAAKLPAASNGSIFTDLPLQCTWETSRGQTGESGILTNFLGGSAAKNFTTDRFDKFKEELNRVFRGIGDKFDGKRAMMNWPEYKFTRGSYTCPLVGQYTTLLAAAAPAELDGRLIFAGEHTSGDFSGFMNGAVESGNRAAKEIIEPKKEELEKAA
ncbi:MAG TPA: FAD-dependent oxidoreductase [Chthoniobacterales bacterium]|nr:FAD-dependent oxidoreductase [Chthoniobacterales bacterium]